MLAHRAEATAGGAHGPTKKSPGPPGTRRGVSHYGNELTSCALCQWARAVFRMKAGAGRARGARLARAPQLFGNFGPVRGSMLQQENPSQAGREFQLIASKRVGEYSTIGYPRRVPRIAMLLRFVRRQDTPPHWIFIADDGALIMISLLVRAITDRRELWMNEQGVSFSLLWPCRAF
jgi:hypothetical protein